MCDSVNHTLFPKYRRHLLKFKFKNTRTRSAATWPSRGLRHRPAVFFHHIRLTAIPFTQENIRRVFHKCYNYITYSF